MKNLIIIGAGGMGRSIYNLAIECEGYLCDYEIKGFIDDNLNKLDGYKGYPPLLGTIKDYQVINNDVFVNSLGEISAKKKCITDILNRGGVFINLIHPKASINLNARIGKGCVILENAVISVDTTLGDYTLIQNGAIIGHDVTIGNWSRIDNYVVLVGGVIIGNETCIHTGAIINHKVIVHDNASVGAGSFVIRDVKKCTTVYGNPAKRL